MNNAVVERGIECERAGVRLREQIGLPGKPRANGGGSLACAGLVRALAKGFNFGLTHLHRVASALTAAVRNENVGRHLPAEGRGPRRLLVLWRHARFAVPAWTRANRRGAERLGSGARLTLCNLRGEGFCPSPPASGRRTMSGPACELRRTVSRFLAAGAASHPRTRAFGFERSGEGHPLRGSMREARSVVRASLC